jgi:glycosyltransferase involved in cell wall biosynthesis
MRILILTSVDNPRQRFEAEALSKLFEVRYLPIHTFPNRTQFIKDGLSSLLRNLPTLLIASVKLRIPPVPLSQSLANILWAASAVNKANLRQSRYDLIYAHWLFPAGFAGLMFSKILRCKVVSEICGFDVQAAPWAKGYGISGSKRIISKYVIRRSDRILAFHRFHAEIAVSLAGAGCVNKVVYIPPGIPDLTKVDTKQLGLPIEVARKRDQIANCRIVLYAPSLQTHYGIMDLIEAIPLVTSASNAYFVIVGSGDPDHAALDLARREGIADRVTFLGRVDHHTMLNLYRVSHLVCDLCYFGHGITTLEAFCFHKPVIGIASPKRFIDDRKNGFLIRRGDHRALACHISKLLADDNLSAIMSRKARESFERNFDMKDRVDALAALFHLMRGTEAY